PISLANATFRAWNVLQAYLTISAAYTGTANNSAGTQLYNSRSTASDCGSLTPRTVIGGFWKSFTADPSRRNSGLVATPKSLPAFLPLALSSAAVMKSAVVPGRTVLRVTTI